MIVILSVAVLWSGAISLNSYLENRASNAWFKAYSLPTGSPEQISALDKVAKDYHRRSAGKRALLNLAQFYLKSDPVKAREYFEKLRSVAHEKHFLQVAALYGIAQTYQNQNMWKEAAESYLKAAALPGNAISLQSKYEAALCFEHAGEYKKAKEIYANILTAEESETSKMAKERLLWLDISKL